MSREWSLQENQAEAPWPFTIWPPVSQDHFHCVPLAKAATPPPELKRRRAQLPSLHGRASTILQAPHAGWARPEGCAGQTGKNIANSMPARHKGIALRPNHWRSAATVPEHRPGSGATSRGAFLVGLPWTCGPDPMPDPNATCTQPGTGATHSGHSPASAQPQNTPSGLTVWI